MKLFYAVTSPYARKVRLTLREKGLEAEEIHTSPYDDMPELRAANPLGAVPTFIRDDGNPLYDSPVICAWLDSLTEQNQLIPADETRWEILRGEALCDGILDAAFSSVMEKRRPETEQSSYWLDRWERAIIRSLDVIENDLSVFQGELTIAQLALGSALGYLDFRLPHLKWQEQRPNTAAWFEAFSNRQSMIDTKPE